MSVEFSIITFCILGPREINSTRYAERNNDDHVGREMGILTTQYVSLELQ